MEQLFAQQDQIQNEMRQLISNFKKDGPTRNTVEKVQRRLQQIDALWHDFQHNHIKLCEYKDRSFNYFVDGVYERVSLLYRDAREFIARFLEQEEAGPSAGPSKPELSQAGLNQPDPNQQQPRIPTNPLPQQPRQDPQDTARQVGVYSKTDELIKKQFSNFRAFERTVMGINLNLDMQQWELQDLLRTLQMRWSAIDGLHWEIDSELEGTNMVYETTFSNHERTFISIKKAINDKLWSVVHKEKTTPQMEIPTFSGSFHHWISFKDLFTETIHNNRLLSNAQKMQFLKSKVHGEAERIISHLQISSENYEACWELLNNRFNNKKLIFTSHINTLLLLPVANQLSLNHIKKVHDTTLESLNAIKNLGVNISSWDPLLVHLITQKLDSATYDDYVESLKNPKDLPVLQDLMHFLEAKFTAMESASRKTYNNDNHGQKASNWQQTFPQKSSFNKTPRNTYSGTKSTQARSDKVTFKKKYKCPVCKNEHGIYFCPTFLNMNASLKFRTINNLNLCHNCLYAHGNKACTSAKRCRECNESHNTILHECFAQSSTHVRASVTRPPPEAMANHAATAAVTRGDQQNQVMRTNANVASHISTSEILLATAIIKVEGADGMYYDMRVLIDQGSQSSLISSAAAKKLALPRQKCKGLITGIGSKDSICKGLITIKCKSSYNDYIFITEVYIMDKLINNLPTYSFLNPTWSHLANKQLADPDFNISRPIDILLGADIYSQIILEGISRAPNHEAPIAQQTQLGWILSGNTRTFHCNVILHEMEDFKKFWEIEEITQGESSYQEDECIKYYKSTTRRLSNGRYQVRLPLKANFAQNLGLSKSSAVAQFKTLERRFNKDNTIAINYKEFIDEYLWLGHMKPCVGNKLPEYFMPHHCVLRQDSTTTALRVVFNASSKTSTGYSLNDLMDAGPNLQQDLQALILKWRQYKVVFSADIKKFFRQIWVHEDDQALQKIVWRSSPNMPIQEYQLLTVTYGTKAAPFLCMMTLRQLVEDEKENYPGSKALQAIKESFYMDDLLYGSHDIQSAKQIQEDIIDILASAGLKLAKWKSNNDYLLQDVNMDGSSKEKIEFKQVNSTKTLGLLWDPEKDVFTFQSQLGVNNKHTKRSLLSEISRLFDPLGWLTPLSTKLKLLFQSVWQTSAQWDDRLPENILSEWLQIRAELNNIGKFTIKRWLNIQEKDVIELHGFSDSSLKAFSCVIYSKISRQDNTYINIVMAKSRIVSTSKKYSIPRLELCGAHLLSTVMEKVKDCLPDYDIKIYGWTDSTAVLGWLQGDIARWTPFVANRISQIREIIPATSWRYVKSTDNPADCASRGVTVAQLQDNQLWWSGPTWLPTYKDQESISNTYETEQEVRRSYQVNVTQQGAQTNIVKTLLDRYSDYNKVVHVLAWVLRFCSKIKNRTSYLSITEIRSARLMIIKYIQNEHFSTEKKDLINKKMVNSKSKLLNLTPYIDNEGLIRVKGRLNKAKISFDMKHPIIIPKNSRLTELLIDHAHVLTYHGGPRLTHNFIRQYYWVIGGNQVVKKRLRTCITCRRQQPDKRAQMMGDLPQARINISRPFQNTGVDFTGHVYIKSAKGRGIKTTKGYVAVFVCMATKAIHLELVSDLTTSGFLAALRRMVARRGKPTNIFSDNGKNFGGANKVLQQELEEIKAAFNDSFLKEVADLEINWNFNAPSWPSAGGLWEAAVKSLKFHLKRVVGDQKLTYEEYSTILSQLEACLNSRPLVPLSDDPNNGLDYLTPAHFLSSGPNMTIVETERDLRTRWHLTQKIVHDTWKRWQAEYLSQLAPRSKWNKPHENIKINDIVLIHEANLPPGKWAMARVIDLHPGSDGLVRVVTLKTRNGVLKRPITKLSILPVHKEQDNVQKSASNQVENGSSSSNHGSQIKKKSKQGLPKSQSFFSLVTLFLLFISIFSPVNTAYNATRIRENQGLFFDKMGDIKLIRDEWKIITYYQMDPYWKGIETIKKYTQHLSNICSSNKGNSQCEIMILQLQHEQSELEYYNQLLMSQHSGTSRGTRARRGLINGVGYLANSLFGVLDERFARQYQRDITSLKYSQHHLEKLARNQTSLIETQYNFLKRTQETIDTHHKVINKKLDLINKTFDEISKDLRYIASSTEFSLLAITASNLVQSLKHMQGVLLDTITNIYHERFEYHLITPDQLKLELNKISGNMPTDVSLPIDNIQEELPKLYQLFKIKVRMLKEYLIFEIRFPLITRDAYELFEIVSVPKIQGSFMTNVLPISSYVAIDIKKGSYLPITDKEMQACMIVEGEYYCTFNTPIYQLNQDNDLCVRNITSKPQECLSVSKNCKNQWHQLNKINTYFYFCCNECQMKIICENQVSKTQLTRVGIFVISPGCIAKLEQFTLVSHRSGQSTIYIQADIQVPEIASINHVFNFTIPRINFSEPQKEASQEVLLTKIREGVTNLQQASEPIDEEQEVSSHDVHHYVMIYVLVCVGGVCAALCWCRRARNRSRAAAAGTPHACSAAGLLAPPASPASPAPPRLALPRGCSAPSRSQVTQQSVSVVQCDDQNYSAVSEINNKFVRPKRGSVSFRRFKKVNRGTSPIVHKSVVPNKEEYI